MRKTRKHLVTAFLVIVSLAFVALHFKPLLTLYFINDDLTILYGAKKTFDISDSKIDYLMAILAAPSTFDLAYRPFSVMLYPAVLFKVFGLEPNGYRLVNLAVHLLNTVLLFFLIQAVFNNKATAYLTALLYGIRDYHYVNLAYAVAGSADLLVQTTMITTLLFYLKYLRDGRSLDLSFVYLFCILSFLCKEIAVTLFGLLLLMFGYQHLVVLKSKIEPRSMRHLILPLAVTCLFVVSRIFLQQSGAQFPSRLEFDSLIPFRFFSYLAYTLLGSQKGLPFGSASSYANLLEFYMGVGIFVLCIIGLRHSSLREKTMLALLWFGITISPMLLQPGRHAVHYAVIPSYLLIGVLVAGGLHILTKARASYRTAIIFGLVLYVFINWQVIQLKYHDRIWTGGYIRTADSARLATMLHDVQRIVPVIRENTKIHIANYYNDAFITASPGGEDYRVYFVGEHLLKLFYDTPRMEVVYLHPDKPKAAIPVNWFTDVEEFFASYETGKDVLLVHLDGHFYDFSEKIDEARRIVLEGWPRSSYL